MVLTHRAHMDCWEHGLHDSRLLLSGGSGKGGQAHAASYERSGGCSAYQSAVVVCIVLGYETVTKIQTRTSDHTHSRLLDQLN